MQKKPIEAQKCALIMDFTETASIELIMRCFMEYVVYLHWKVQILNVIKMWWPILIKNLSQLEDFQEKWDGAWRD